LGPLSLIARLAPPYSAFASIYDNAIGNDFFAQLRELFERLIRRHRIRFASAADLGCGTGLFARYLNSLWKVPVFAVDESPSMLRVAANNCRDTGVILLRQDIRELRLPRRVDLVTANFDTLNHLLCDGDLPAVFREVYRHLNPGGYFIFDLITPCNPPSGTRVYREWAGTGVRQVIQRIRWLPARGIFLSHVVVRGPASIENTVERHRERAYPPRDVGKWLMDAGFVVREVLDGATLRWARTCRPRVIIVAQKPVLAH
jgi:SAM-dependent methyltransferase